MLNQVNIIYNNRLLLWVIKRQRIRDNKLRLDYDFIPKCLKSSNSSKNFLYKNKNKIQNRIPLTMIQRNCESINII